MYIMTTGQALLEKEELKALREAREVLSMMPPLFASPILREHRKQLKQAALEATKFLESKEKT